ncbi:histidine triad nucleotide-binding protein [Candidatus Parcubacteria bacterium]|nr:histidine triad nucleotide-binding protein [Candidatus Parcubacteria bacterium]
MACLFCQIINKEIPADIIYEDEKFVVFKDIKPKAPIHLLILPKKHIPSVQHLELEDKELIGELFFLAKKIAQERDIAEKGYKLVFNVGRGGGQVIEHLHLHLIAGWKTAQERDIPGMP